MSDLKELNDDKSAAVGYVPSGMSSVPSLSAMCGMGTQTILVGVEDGPDGALKMYLGARYKGVYVLVTDDEAKDAVRRAWGCGRMIWLDVPPQEYLHVDEREPVVVEPVGGDRHE